MIADRPAASGPEAAGNQAVAPSTRSSTERR
jgi:hypothetical protein